MAEPGNKISEKLFITVAPFRMILHRQGERMVPQPHLLDDVIGCAPGLDLQALTEPVERLVMRAVDELEAMLRRAVSPQRLDVVLLHLGRVVPGNIEPQRTAQRDVEKLHALADGEDRQIALEGIFRRGEFPAVPFRIDVGVDNGRVGHRLIEKFWGDIGAAGQEQAVHFLKGDFLGPGIPKPHVRVLPKGATKPFLVFGSNPGGHVRHGRTLRPFISIVNSSPPMIDEHDKTRQLQEACERIMGESKPVAYAVALHDYETGLRFSINADRHFHAASTIKVAILLAIGKALDEGKIRGSDTLHVRNRFLSAVDGTPFRIDAESDGYPQLHRLIGRTAKVSDLSEWMIVSSSNLATNLLLDYITVEYAQRVLREAGVNGVELRRGVDDARAHEQSFNNQTTASGLLELFATLRGDFLSKTSRDLAINILLQQRFNSMIPAPLPSHASVAHKTGEISTACHDAGIIYLPEREPYILVVLTEVAAESNGRRETVAKISENVYRCLTAAEERE